MNEIPLRLSICLFALGIAGTGSAFAAPLPCQTASLQTYVATGPCSVGNLTFSNFNLLTNPSGAPEIGADSITVTPTSSAFTQSLEFGFRSSAVGSLFGSSFERIFTYLVMPMGTFTNASISLMNSSATGDGAVLGNQFICQGGALSADGSSCASTGTFFNQAVVEISPSDPTLRNASLPLNFNSNSLFVRNEIAVDGGTSGSAAGGAFTNSFTAVPEPGNLTMVGSVVLGALILRRRSFKGQI